LEQSETDEARRNIVVIGASAGGVEALSILCKKLPEHLEEISSILVYGEVGAREIEGGGGFS
jgi:chemotaxis response regulator CheB